LFLHDLDDARRSIARLERLVVAALGGPLPMPADTASREKGPT
jgi:hypothetical protein